MWTYPYIDVMLIPFSRARLVWNPTVSSSFFHLLFLWKACLLAYVYIFGCNSQLQYRITSSQFHPSAHAFIWELRYFMLKDMKFLVLEDELRLWWALMIPGSPNFTSVPVSTWVRVWDPYWILLFCFGSGHLILIDWFFFIFTFLGKYLHWKKILLVVNFYKDILREGGHVEIGPLYSIIGS